MMKLSVTPEAINDIGEIKEYIRDELDNLKAANRIADAIRTSYKGLKQTPLIGRELSKYINFKTDYRFLTCENYLIFYRIEKNVIKIVHIIDGRRDYCRVLFGISLNDVLIEDITED